MTTRETITITGACIGLVLFGLFMFWQPFADLVVGGLR